MSPPLGAHDIFANEVWKCHSGLCTFKESCITAVPMWSPLATCKKGFSMDDFKTNYSVARVVTHTKDNISKFEKHNARKN